MKPLHFFFLLTFFLSNLRYYPSFSQTSFSEVPAPGGSWGTPFIFGTQDPKGYMWFGSNGIHRYDGYNYKSYFNDPSDSTSLGFNRIQAIYADRSGIIWVGTNGLGLDRLDPDTGIFTHFRHDPSDSTTISNDLVSIILEDRNEMIWVGTEGGGLNCLDPKTGKFTRFMHDPNDSNSLSNDEVRALYEDRYGTLWVGTGFPYKKGPKWKKGGLNRFDPNAKSFTRFVHDPNDPSSLIDNRIWTIYEDSKSRFWVGTAGDGLHIMDREKGSFKRLPYNAEDPNGLSRPPLGNNFSWVEDFIIFLREDAAGILWIGTSSGGLNRYDPETKTMDYYSSLLENSTDITQVASLIWSYTSKDGVLWVAGSEGVFRMDPLHKQIPHFDVGMPVSSILQESTGELWVGTDQGVLVYDSARVAKEWFVNAKSDTSSLSDNRVHTIFEDRKGTVWIGTEIGLNRFDPQSKKFNRYFDSLSTNINDFIPTNRIHSVYEDRAESFWLGTYHLLSLLNREAETYTYYGQKQFDTIQGHLTTIRENRAGYLWVGSLSGLKRFDKKTNSFGHYLTGFIIRSIFEDSEGVFWIGTNRGLFYYHPSQNDFVPFTNPDLGLTGNVNVFHILEDDQRSLWINTSIGIFRLGHGRSEISLFGKNRMNPSFTGTQNNCFKGIGGELFFGDNSSGYYAFFPEKLKTNTIAPDLQITGFRIGDQLAVFGKDSFVSISNSRVEPIRLFYNENVFSFEFAGIHYSSPEENQHFFMLENFENNWQKASEEKTAYYFNVPPGDYVFRVKASNSDGVWAEKSISIFISPPWWGTWWAYLTYILLLGGIIYSVYNFQLKQRLRQAEAIRLKELDAVKTKLYTNITHEFRTPLTVILGVANQVLENPNEHLKKGLRMIMRNGQNLLTLVNQMLDLSKLESGKLSLQYHHADVISFLGYIVDSFHSLADSKGILIHFIPDKDQLNMDFDEVRLQQVVSNIISNAIKFTPKGGNVYVSTDTKNDSFILKIKDTGIGIDEADLPHIFDRFYQADDSQTRQGEGTGIGLALTHELVKLMHGTIAVKSKKGQGSEFEVVLPLRIVSDSETTNEVPLESMGTDTKYDYSISIDEGFESSLITSFNHENGSAHVLIADDNEDVLAFVASCLENEFAVEVAKNGQECEEMAFNSTPDLIVMDVMMPFKDGFEICKTLKTDERTSHIPIILLTAKADLESKLQGLEQGADDYLTKPFHKKELLLRIKNLLDLRSQLQQFYRSSLEGSLSANSLHDPDGSNTNAEFNGSKSSDSGIPNPSIPLASSLENAFVIKVRKAIEANLEEPDFDVEKLCRSLALSHSQVHRKLSALTGLSATHFIRYVRLIKAKEMILNSGFSMTAIAYDCGFNDPAYFSRIFKQEFGVSPQAWREENSG